MSVTVNLNNTERVMYQGNNHVKCIYGPNNQLLWSEEEYFIVELVDTSTLGLQCYGSATPVTLYYWVNTIPNAARDNYTGTITANSSGSYIQNLASGDKIRFYRAETTAWRGDTTSDYNKFRIGTGNTKIYGNIASLFGFNQTIPQYACFQMFAYEGVKDASGLILPWNSLSTGCFQSMFLSCSVMNALPVLPATDLSGCNDCYRTMFRGTACTGMATMFIKNIDGTTGNTNFYCMYQLCPNITSVTVPELTFTNSGRLWGAFWGCAGLTTAEVKIPTNYSIPQYAYRQLFYGCSNLNDVTCLATSFASNTFNDWLNGVAASGTFTKAAGVTWTSGASGIPSGWTVVEE